MCLPVTRSKYTTTAIKNGSLVKNRSQIGIFIESFIGKVGIPSGSLSVCCESCWMNKKDVSRAISFFIVQKSGNAIGTIVFVRRGRPIGQLTVIGCWSDIFGRIFIHSFLHHFLHKSSSLCQYLS